MDEQKLPVNPQVTQPSPPKAHGFPTGKKEICLWWVIVALCVLWVDFAFYGGFALGTALVTLGLIILPWVYLPKKRDPYATALLVLSCILSGSFLRSNDGFVKFISLCFLTVSVPLALTLISGKNRQNPKGLASLLDAPWAWFYLGVGRLPESVHGLLQAGKAVEQGSKKRRAALLGLLVAVPVVAVVMALLSSADAAFDGLLQQIPRMDLSEPAAAIVLGLFPAPVIYTLCVALRNESSDASAPWQPKGIDPITVNTVLGAVCAVYLVYLCSQLAYFVGGLSGLLPEEYTLAQYARRGFFEMAILCMLNLGFIAAGNGLVGKKDGRAPLTTRIMSLCIGLVTLFFVVTASAKMFLYIDSFGLTRLRVLTEVIMVFLAIATIFACIWLFVPKFAYMKAILLTALTLCSITAWADVDTVVAHYNVRAYQTGKAPFVDVYHLGELSQGAIPALEALAADADPETAAAAKSSLRKAAGKLEDTDLRSLTIAQLIARPILGAYKLPEATADTPQINYGDRIDFAGYRAHFQFAAEEILRRTSPDGQWRQLVYVTYSDGPVLEDIRSGDQFHCDPVLAKSMDQICAAFPYLTNLQTVVVWNGEVHFCDSNDKIALAYSPIAEPAWLGNPFSPLDVTVEGLGGGWFHVTR